MATKIQESVAVTPSQPATTTGLRIGSLDQFRGYTVLGMFFVNFMGRFNELPAVFKHHNTYFSYADSIMPQFFFAIGVAYRLTFLRTLKKSGVGSTYWKFIKRNLGLILLGVVVYTEGATQPWYEFVNRGFTGAFGKEFLRHVFQTLVHIGVTALWIMPVISAGPAVRIVYTILSAALHLALSYFFYFTWVISDPGKGIDGGVLGFLTWTIPMIAGTLACDVLLSRPRFGALVRFLLWGVVLMAVAYFISCFDVPPQSATSPDPAGKPAITFRPPELPFVEPGPEWGKGTPVSILQISQRAGSVTYLIMGAGFSLVVYALFVLLCDGRLNLGIGFFRTLGTNALAAYLIHEMVGRALSPFTPKDAPLWYAMTMFGIYLGIIYIFLRYLEKRGMFLRL
jgi:predicted acyltransferase